MSTERLTKEATQVLRDLAITTDNGHSTVEITSGQLERDLYLEVNEVLQRLRGKYVPTAKKHAFPYDPRDVIAAVVATGLMPPKNRYAYYPTPQPVREQMLRFLDTKRFNQPNVRILEPSAGWGSIAQDLRERFPLAQLDVVEIDTLNRKALVEQGFNLIGDDFLEFSDEPYDLIVMNPPFTIGSNVYAYIDHIMRAWSLLKDRGRLISIAPPSFQWNSTEKERRFHELVWTAGEVELLPDGAFGPSGTGTNTCIIDLRKMDLSWTRDIYVRYERPYHCLHCERLQVEYISNTDTWHTKELALIEQMEADPFALDLFGDPTPKWQERIKDFYVQAGREARSALHWGLYLEDACLDASIAEFMDDYRQMLPELPEIRRRRKEAYEAERRRKEQERQQRAAESRSRKVAYLARTTPTDVLLEALVLSLLTPKAESARRQSKTANENGGSALYDEIMAGLEEATELSRLSGEIVEGMLVSLGYGESAPHEF